MTEHQITGLKSDEFALLVGACIELYQYDLAELDISAAEWKDFQSKIRVIYDNYSPNDYKPTVAGLVEKLVRLYIAEDITLEGREVGNAQTISFSDRKRERNRSRKTGKNSGCKF